MKDFNNVVNCGREFWKIDDDFLKEKLISINSNLNVQTLYSKYGNQGPDDSHSYLEFAFTRKIETKIFRSVLPDILYRFNSIDLEESNCYYEYSKPRKNLNYRYGSEKFGMNCTDDKDYFRINTIRIQLETYDLKIKTQFWTDIELVLSKLE